MGGDSRSTDRGEQEPTVQRKTVADSLCCRLLTATVDHSWLSRWLSAGNFMLALRFLRAEICLSQAPSLRQRALRMFFVPLI